MTFECEDLYGNLSGTLQEDRSTFYFCWWHKFNIKAVFVQDLVFLYYWQWYVAHPYHRMHCWNSIAIIVMQTCVSLSPIFHVHISDTIINITVWHINIKNTQTVIILWYFFPIQPYNLFYEHYTLSKRNLFFNKMCFLFLRTNKKHLKQARTHLNNAVIQLCQSGRMILFKYKNNNTLIYWKQHMNFWKLNT
jgi:hypothetical protein